MKTNNKGFSLVELIVVIAIMAVLAAVAIPTFAGFITKANIASDVSFMQDVEYAIQISNAATPEKVITDIVVTCDDGAIESISYKLDGTATTVDEDSEIGMCFDWDYTFKAYKNGATIATINAEPTENE